MSKFFTENEIKPKVGEIIRTYYQELLVELESDDPDVKAAYKSYSKKIINSVIDHIKSIDEAVEQSKMYSKYVRIAKRGRTKKTTPVSKQVISLQYMKMDKDLGIASVDPAKIPGSNIVWLYNVKHRKVTLIRSEKGFKVKGTTIKDFDEKRSLSTTMRKPELIMPLTKISKGASSADNVKFFKELTTKKRPANGRVNKNTIILRVL